MGTLSWSEFMRINDRDWSGVSKGGILVTGGGEGTILEKRSCC